MQSIEPLPVVWQARLIFLTLDNSDAITWKIEPLFCDNRAASDMSVEVDHRTQLLSPPPEEILSLQWGSCSVRVISFPEPFYSRIIHSM